MAESQSIQSSADGSPVIWMDWVVQSTSRIRPVASSARCARDSGLS